MDFFGRTTITTTDDKSARYPDTGRQLSAMMSREIIEYRHGSHIYDFPLPASPQQDSEETSFTMLSMPTDEKIKSIGDGEGYAGSLGLTKAKSVNTSLVERAGIAVAALPTNEQLPQQNSPSLNSEPAYQRQKTDLPRRFASVQDLFRRSPAKTREKKLPTLSKRVDTAPFDIGGSFPMSGNIRKPRLNFITRPQTPNSSQAKISIDGSATSQALSITDNKTATSPLRRLEHWLESSFSPHLGSRRGLSTFRSRHTETQSPTLSLDPLSPHTAYRADMKLFDFGFDDDGASSGFITSAPTPALIADSPKVSDVVSSSRQSLNLSFPSAYNKPLPALTTHQLAGATKIEETSRPGSSAAHSGKHIKPSKSIGSWFSENDSHQARSTISSSSQKSDHTQAHAKAHESDTCSIESLPNAPWSDLEPITPRSSVDYSYFHDPARDAAYGDVQIATARQVTLEQASWGLKPATIQQAKKPVIVDLDRGRRRGRAYTVGHDSA